MSDDQKGAGAGCACLGAVLTALAALAVIAAVVYKVLLKD